MGAHINESPFIDLLSGKVWSLVLRNNLLLKPDAEEGSAALHNRPGTGTWSSGLRSRGMRSLASGAACFFSNAPEKIPCLWYKNISTPAFYAVQWDHGDCTGNSSG
jgi:hypothetical protein